MKYDTWIIKIYRRDSTTPIEYIHCKHAWFEDNSRRLVISIYESPPEHYYVHWPMELISHITMKRDTLLWPNESQSPAQLLQGMMRA